MALKMSRATRGNLTVKNSAIEIPEVWRTLSKKDLFDLGKQPP